MSGRLAPMLCAALALGVAPAARAQMTLPQSVPAPSGKALFLNQCGTCHSLDPGDPRQGPTLGHVLRRRAGTVPGFKYSPGFARADFAWDPSHLDAWLAAPQKLIPGAVILYSQPDAAVRRTIIAYLQEQK